MNLPLLPCNLQFLSAKTKKITVLLIFRVSLRLTIHQLIHQIHIHILSPTFNDPYISSLANISSFQEPTSYNAKTMLIGIIYAQKLDALEANKTWELTTTSVGEKCNCIEMVLKDCTKI